MPETPPPPNMSISALFLLPGPGWCGMVSSECHGRMRFLKKGSVLRSFLKIGGYPPFQ